MLFGGGFSFANFFIDALTLFAFVVWFWLLITVLGDLFRRPDVSGWIKALWVLFVILFPYVGVLAYTISQGKAIAERNAARIRQMEEELRRSAGFSIADEIEKLDRLKKSGSISDTEFARLRTRLVQ